MIRYKKHSLNGLYIIGKLWHPACLWNWVFNKPENARLVGQNNSTRTLILMKTLTKKSLLALLSAGVISLALLGQQAQAVPITGSIGFAGLATFNTNSLGTATQVINFQPFAGGTNNRATVTNATGSFLTTITPGVLATFPNVYIFNPSSAVTPLWTVGGFTFNLTSSVINLQNLSLIHI